MSDTTSEPMETFDPQRRHLCPDGACVGVVGDDGRCRVCGRTEAEAAAGDAPVEADDAVAADTGDAGAAAAGTASVGVDAAGGFDSKRRLCDDGSCVGVIGNDGTCRVCGRRAG